MIMIGLNPHSVSEAWKATWSRYRYLSQEFRSLNDSNGSWHALTWLIQKSVVLKTIRGQDRILMELFFDASASPS